MKTVTMMAIMSSIEQHWVRLVVLSLPRTREPRDARGREK